MSKTASQRRFDKRAIELGALFRSDPNAFARVWEQYVRGWLVEIGSRARAQRSGEADERHLRIFEVLTLAQRVAHAAVSHALRAPRGPPHASFDLEVARLALEL